MRLLRITPKDVVSKYAIVTLDGVDITQDCFLANERVGVVGIYPKNEQGRRYVENGKVVREYREGEVKISLRDNAPEGAVKFYSAFREKITL